MGVRRLGGRHAKRQTEKKAKSIDSAWRQWINPYAPVNQFSEDEIEAIHLTSLEVLRDKGIKVLSAEARKIYLNAGFHAEDETVFFDPDHLMERVAKAPKEVTLFGRNPQCDVSIGGNKVAVSTIGGAPNYSDIECGRQPGTLDRLRDFYRVAQSFDVIHLMGPIVEPQDVAPGIRHLEMTRMAIMETDKVPFVFFRGTQAVADAYEIIRLGHGLSESEFTDRPVCYSVANSNSPLQLDLLMCRGIIDAAKAGQLMILTPFTLAGAMAPVTVVGALVQQNAEALSGIALSQIVRAGAPVCYGSFTSNVDMRTGSPAFGTPEYTKAAFAAGQLARRYNLPMRSSAVTASNYPDAQAAYETQMSMWGALMGGANVLLHGAGWLEGGLTASAEKFIMDVEMLQMFAELFKPLEVNQHTLAKEAILDVDHGGHFFSTQHTLDRYEDAFYKPLLSDWDNFERWQETGSVNATTRANGIFKQALANHESPLLDVARIEAIDDFVARRIKEGGANLEC